MKRILTSPFFKCLCLESIGHWLMAWCLFDATLFARGYSQPMWSRWTCLRLSEDTQNMYEMGQRNWSKNVNNKRPFRTCFRLLTSPTWSHWLQIAQKLSLTPCRDWTGCSVRYRGTRVEVLPNTLPPDTHWPAGWLYPLDDMGLQHSCASRAHRQAPE